MVRLAAAVGLAWGVTGAPARAADLQPETVAAFERYVRLTEQRMTANPYAGVAGRPRGTLFIEPVVTRDRGEEIDVPGGLIHHWIGAVFVPGATVDQAVALLQDYNRHAEIYTPTVARSRLLARDGNTFKVYLRFMMKKVITVVVNSEHEARFTRDAPDRARSRIVSTRIAEVENAGTPEERENPVGRDGGYLWRLNTYWRFLERDDGVHVECESITLTRGIPAGVGWLVRPFVTSIPRESLTFTLERTRQRLAAAHAPAIDRGTEAPQHNPVVLSRFRGPGVWGSVVRRANSD
jgi:hypothetical protein